MLLGRGQLVSAERAVESFVHPVLKAGGMELVVAWRYHKHHKILFLQIGLMFTSFLLATWIVHIHIADIFLIVFLRVIDIGVLLERNGADGASLLELLVSPVDLLVVVEVVRNEFVGDDEPGPEVPLQCDETKQNERDAYKDDEHLDVIGFPGQGLEIVAVVDKRQPAENDGEE